MFQGVCDPSWIRDKDKMPGHNHKKNHHKKKHHETHEKTMSPHEQAGIDGLTVVTNSSEKNNGQSVNHAASGDEGDTFASANSTPRYPHSGSVSREGSISPPSMSPRVADIPPASPKHDVSDDHAVSQTALSTENSKTQILHDLNENLLKQVKGLRSDKDNLAKKVAELEEQLNAVNDTEAKRIAPTSEHSIEVDQQKPQISETEFLTLKEFATTVADEKDALMKERDSLISEKNRLEETVSKFRVESEEVERSSTAANQRVLALEKETESLMTAKEDLVALQESASKLSTEKSSLLEEKASLLLEKEAQEKRLSALEEELAEAKKSAGITEDEISTLKEKVKSLVAESHELRESQIHEKDFLALKDNVMELTQSRDAVLKEKESLSCENERLQQEISERKSELDEAEKRFVVAEERAQSLKEEVKSLSFKVEELLAQSAGFRQNASELSQERDALVKEKDSLHSEKRVLEDDLKRSKQDLEDAGKEKKILVERVEALEKDAESLKQANRVLIGSQIPEVEFLSLKDSVTRLSQEKAAVEEEKGVLLSEKRELEDALFKSRQELEEVKKLSFVAQERVPTLEKDIEGLGVDLSKFKKAAEELEFENGRIRNENTRLEGVLTDAHSQEEVYNRKVKDLEAKVKELSTELESSDMTMSELREELLVAKEQSTELAASLEKKHKECSIQEEDVVSKVTFLESTISSLKQELEHVKQKSAESSALVESKSKEFDERVESLDNQILHLQDELGTAKSEASEANDILAFKTREFCEKVQELETQTISLQEKLKGAKSEAMEAAARFEIEQEIFDSHTKELTGKLKELQSRVELLESQLQTEKYKAAEAAQTYKDDGQDFSLKISTASAENEKLKADLGYSADTIQSLQETIASSHAKCEELLAELTELKNGRDKSLELDSWQSQVKTLEETLENAKWEARKKEKMYEELELAKYESDKRTETTKYILPAATATGALAATGLMLILKAVSRQ